MTRNTPASDVIEADAFSVAELRKMVFEEEGPLSRPLALSLLARKTYPQKVRDLERLLMNEDETPRLRNLAGVALGRVGTPAAVKALQRGLDVRENLALRGVMEGLSLAGGEDGPSVVRPLKRRAGATGETAKRTATLLSYRHGARGSEIDRAAQSPLRVSPRRATPIEIRAARGKQVEEALARMSEAVPALALTKRGATSLRCEGRSFMFLFGHEAATEGLERFTAKKAQAGVVASRKVREGRGWGLKYHVLTEPQADGRIVILVTTGKGRLMLAGTARVKGGRADFDLRSVEGAGALPVGLEGTYDGRRLMLTEARSDRRRRPSPAPARLEVQEGGRRRK